MRLIVTIPAQNEAATIGRVVREVPRCIDGIDEVDIVVVDDGSTDATAAKAQAAGARVVPISGRPGLGPVWRLGMERAIRLGADIIVNIDGDGQFDSRDIARIVQPLIRGECDFITCTRFAGGGPVGHMPLAKRWGNRAVTRLTNRICGTHLTDVSCGFRAYNREAAYRLAQFGRWTYTEESIVYLVSRGLRIREMPFQVRGEREHGQSRVAGNVFYFASHLIHILARAVRDGQPLKFFGIISFLLSAPGALLLLFVLGWYLSYGTTQPFTRLMTVGGVSLTVGLVVGVLALLADMVSRHRLIHEELLYLARWRVYGNGKGRSMRELQSESAALAGLFDD